MTGTKGGLIGKPRVVDLFVLGGTGDLEVLKKKYINAPFNEFEQLIKKLHK